MIDKLTVKSSSLAAAKSRAGRDTYTSHVVANRRGASFHFQPTDDSFARSPDDENPPGVIEINALRRRRPKEVTHSFRRRRRRLRHNGHATGRNVSSRSLGARLIGRGDGDGGGGEFRFLLPRVDSPRVAFAFRPRFARPRTPLREEKAAAVAACYCPL